MQIITLPALVKNRILRIPAYQRGYAWQESNVDDLWQDLASIEPDGHHFTGTITTESVAESAWLRWQEREFADTNGETSCLERLYVVDGQQRLITIFLLIQSLFDRFGSDSEAISTLHQETVRPFPSVYRLGYEVDTPSHYHLIEEIFQGIDSREAATAYTRNLDKAKRFFDRNIAEISCSEAETYALKLRAGLRFVHHHLPKELESCVVFERMNNRGRPLSQLELLKNRLLFVTGLIADGAKNSETKQSAVDAKDQINDCWLTIYEWLAKNDQAEPLSDDDFLRNHWYVYFNQDAQQRRHLRIGNFLDDLLKNEFSEKRARRGNLSLDSIREYSQSLSDAAPLWFAINHPLHPSAELIKEHRIWLFRIGSVRSQSFFRPAILAMLLRERDRDESRRYSEDDITGAFQQIERHEFVLHALTGVSASANRPFFWKEANRLYRTRTNSLNKFIRQLVSKTNKPYKETRLKSHMRRVFLSQDKLKGGWAAWRPHLNYLLREYEYDLSGDSCVYLTPGDVRPVYPGRHAQPDWCDYAIRHLGPDADAKIATSLGNFVLQKPRTPDRLEPGVQKARRRDAEDIPRGSFEYLVEHKRNDGDLQGLRHGWANERSVASEPVWDEQAIRRRGLVLINFIQQRWDISLSEPHVLLNLPREK